ncbi:unnamed protein product [Brassicogethes aeneus]|uniref:Protein lethal(2)denticleless n=1 Tax=Brassicogethes aeneus TaxID=1431903 RepID=A0A9P0BEN4_BRAAE|nr:unnamed protein product [Brassicogethes aeneus]
MQGNVVNSFYRQQGGFRALNNYEVILGRFLCTEKNSYDKIYEVNTEQQDLNRDTPIFACKFAQKQGYEHLSALANEDGKLAILNCKTNTRVGGQPHHNAIFDLAWMTNEVQLVTASGDHTIKLLDFGQGDIVESLTFFGHTRSIKTVAFKDNCKSNFATGGRDGDIILWDVRTSTEVMGHPDKVIHSAHVAKTHHHTPSRRKKCMTSTRSGVKSVTGLVFQNENTLISCGAGDGFIKVWDLRRTYTHSKNSPVPLYMLPYAGSTLKNGFSSLMIDRQGLKLYANCLDNSIYCYNIGSYSKKPVMTYTGHQNSSFYIKSSLTEDGKYLISGSSDEFAYIWNTKYGKPIVKLVGHNAEVTSVAWCKNRNYLMTCSDDMTHKLWTVGLEEKPEDWNINGKGHAELLPIEKKSHQKRFLKTIKEYDSPKKFITECTTCKNPVNGLTRCETCRNKKRKLPPGSENPPAKKISGEFGPKRLFVAPLSPNNQTSPKMGRTFIPASPTVNLPNYVIDGVAPHLNLSPAKKRDCDWLTRLRQERRKRRDLDVDQSEGVDKMPRLDATPTRRLRGASPKSPLLRYFKVKNHTITKAKD